MYGLTAALLLQASLVAAAAVSRPRIDEFNAAPPGNATETGAVALQVRAGKTAKVTATSFELHGGRSFSIPVTVGSQTLQMLLDTGSEVT